MFDINSAYGNNRILCNYVGKNLRPIWGEVQHSLWMNTPEFGARSRVFRTIFTWNDILDIGKSIPIGDPFLYQNENLDDSKNYDFMTREKGIIILPKYRRKLSPKDRLFHYTQLLEEARYNFPGEPLLLKLHHSEAEYWKDKTSQFSAFYNLEFMDELTSAISEKNGKIVDTNRILASSLPILTDYLGPHAFRRIVKYDKEVLLSEKTYNYPSIASKMIDLIQEFRSIHTTNFQKKAIANKILGADFIKEPSELGKLLGISGFRGTISPAVKTCYCRWRRRGGNGAI